MSSLKKNIKVIFVKNNIITRKTLLLKVIKLKCLIVADAKNKLMNKKLKKLIFFHLILTI